jgi:hypothetical protein
MIVAPQPINERQRLAALLRYEVLDSAPERADDDIVALAAQICGTSVALMGLVDTDRVWHKARIGVPVEEAPRATSFCQHTILQEVPLVVPDTARDERFCDSPIVVDGPKIRFYAGAPLMTGDGHALGTLCALDTVPRELNAEQMEALAASHGAVTVPDEATTATRALQLADDRMYGEKAGRSQQACRQTHDALLRVLNERDPELQTHGDSVSRLAVAVGVRLGLNAHALDLLGRAAALHDIGKVAVPDAILDKPGALTPEEWDFMRTHTLLGERILAAAPALSEEAALVRSSHERWDGGGYPDQRAGNDIPLGSRIIFACDAYDAMTSPRVYRTARTPTQALQELDRCAGTQFDSDVVAALQAELTATLTLAG